MDKIQGMIPSKNPFTDFLPLEMQEKISEIGCDVMLNMINGDLPGMIFIAVPNRDRD